MTVKKITVSLTIFQMGAREGPDTAIFEAKIGGKWLSSGIGSVVWTSEFGVVPGTAVLDIGGIDSLLDIRVLECDLDPVKNGAPSWLGQTRAFLTAEGDIDDA